jgi:hypothetical protein
LTSPVAPLPTASKSSRLECICAPVAGYPRAISVTAIKDSLYLCALENHAFQNVGRVFSLVRGGLKDFIKFFELDQGNRIFFFFE